MINERPEPLDDAVYGSGPWSARGDRVPEVTIIDAAVAFLVYFMVQIAVELFSFCLLPRFVDFTDGEQLGPCVVTTNIDVLLVMQVVAMVIGAIAILSWLRLRDRLGRALWGKGPHGQRAVWLGLATGILGAGASYLINAMLAFVLRPEAPVQQSVLDAARLGGRTLLIAALVIVLVAPIVEEFLFRGLLFSSLRRRVGLWPAAVVSSILFVGIHVEVVISQPLALVGMFVLSMILSWAFHRSGSLVVPIVAHAVFNAVSLGLMLSLDRLEGLLDEWEAAVATVASILGGIWRAVGG